MGFRVSMMGNSVVFGEVLFDVFPDKKRLGGAPFNFATHIHRLGIPVVFISRVGDDSLGREVLEFARKNNLSTDNIQIDSTHLTGEVRVHLPKKEEHYFEILNQRAWDYIGWTKNIERILNEKISFVYFGTLAQRHPKSRKTLQTILQRVSSDIPIFLDLNLRPPFYDREILAQSLRACNILKTNDEEILKLDDIFNWGFCGDIPSITRKIQAEYDIEIICVTKGENGSELYRKGNEDFLVQKDVALNHFQNSVGAGDAFSAMFAFGLIQQWPDKILLERASLFASRICTITGAIPENPAFYKF